MSHQRLVLADDHKETAALLRGLLEPEFDVVAQVENGLELVSAVARLSPDVIVSDVTMPGLDGISAAAVILRQNPAARIVLVTVHGEDYVIVASKGGAPDHPGWYKNLLANPDAKIQVWGDVIPVTARTGSAADKARVWPLMTAQWPDYDKYQAATKRDIPVVLLRAR